MAQINIPADRAGRIKFISSIWPDSARYAEKIVDNQSQFNDYVISYQRGIEKMFTSQAAQEIGRMSRVMADSTMNSPDQLNRYRQGMLAANFGSGSSVKGEAEFQKGLENFRQQLVGNAKYIDAATLNQGNQLLASAKTVSPTFKYEPIDTTIAGLQNDKSTATPGTTSSAISTSKAPPKRNDYGSLKEYQAALNDWKSGKTGATSTTGSASTTSSSGSATASGTAPFSSSQQEALDFINASELPGNLKALYSQVIEGWDPTQELNAANIISAFNKVKTETIDPYIQGLTNLAIGNIQNSQTSLEKQRAVEMEAEQANAASEMKSTQAGLEASGLTFSGQAVERLGSQAAAPIPFGGVNVEGIVPKKSRLLATSSEAAYKQNLKNLGLSAEQQLGSKQAGGLVPGFTPVGGVQGEMETQRQSTYGSTLGGFINQQIANNNQKNNITVTP